MAGKEKISSGKKEMAENLKIVFNRTPPVPQVQSISDFKNKREEFRSLVEQMNVCFGPGATQESIARGMGLMALAGGIDLPLAEKAQIYAAQLTPEAQQVITQSSKQSMSSLTNDFSSVSVQQMMQERTVFRIQQQQENLKIMENAYYESQRNIKREQEDLTNRFLKGEMSLADYREHYYASTNKEVKETERFLNGYVSAYQQASTPEEQRNIREHFEVSTERILTECDNQLDQAIDNYENVPEGSKEQQVAETKLVAGAVRIVKSCMAISIGADKVESYNAMYQAGKSMTQVANVYQSAPPEVREQIEMQVDDPDMVRFIQNPTRENYTLALTRAGVSKERADKVGMMVETQIGVSKISGKVVSMGEIKHTPAHETSAEGQTKAFVGKIPPSVPDVTRPTESHSNGTLISCGQKYQESAGNDLDFQMKAMELSATNTQ